MKIKLNIPILKKYIKENKLSRSQFSRLLAKHVPTATCAILKAWLDGKSFPSEKYILALAAILGVPVQDLYIFPKLKRGA
jgi:transcriptional regulator with XRE-family HTH domain